MTQEDFNGTTIKLCKCGAFVNGLSGISRHKGRSTTCPYRNESTAQVASVPSESESEDDSDDEPRLNFGERGQRQESVESIEIVEDPEPRPRPRTTVATSRVRQRLPTPAVMAPSRPHVRPVPPPTRAPVQPVAVPSRARVIPRAPVPCANAFEFAHDKAVLDCLASLPATHKQLPPSVAKSFADAAERIAESFLARPSDKAILHLLCLPKIGLAPGQSTTTRDRLDQYPEVPLPKVPSYDPQAVRPLASAIKQVEVGRLGHAARILGGLGSAPSRSDETIQILRDKHPAGSVNPFGGSTGPSPHAAPSTESIVEALYSFKPDTAPGVSGWTVALLKLAVRSESFKKMLTTLVSMVLAGTAPGQGLLCASRLIALEKPDGGVRPIAVGELIYRLCTKAVLRNSFKPDFLSPGQFGVGRKGGVEPLIRAVQRVFDDTIEGTEYTHITSLDFSNAFNSLNRRDMAESIKHHAPGLYRLAKWAYNESSRLVIGGGGDDITQIRSTQGVRQGDPLGPLFFSIGIRPILEKLSRRLGPDCIVLAYLDDVYILSKTDETLDEVQDFFAVVGTTLNLNAAKSSITSIGEIKARGMNMLGSCVGPSWARKPFLQNKIAELEAKVNKLVDVPHQHALLLLRQCMQQDLRHLQRCLVSDDLELEWKKLDGILWRAALRLRSSSEPPDPMERDFDIMSLPVKLGGLGLLSYRTCAPLAYAAASETSDKLLEPLLGPPPSPPTLTDPEDPESISPQRNRCGKAFEAQQETLLNTLDDHQIKTVLESASGLGRKWLSVIPFHQGLRLTDFEISAALHHRTLHPGSAVCPMCGILNSAGHAEVCTKGTKWTIARHEQVKYAIKRALETAEGVQVRLEPFIADTNRRNDLRVTGSEASGLSNHEYDITVVSLARRDAVATSIPLPTQTTKPAERGHALIKKFLDSKAAEKRRRLPTNDIPFTPLVFTVGGMMDDDTGKCLKAWQQSVTASVFSTLCQNLSLILLRAKAKSFVL
jgi:hypothetical protein